MTGFVSELLKTLAPLADLVLGHDPWLFVPDGQGYLLRVEYDPITRRVNRIVSIVTGSEFDAIDLGEGCVFTVGQPLPKEPVAIERITGQMPRRSTTTS